MSTPNPLVRRKPEDMSRFVGHVITVATWGLPLLAVILLGYYVGNGYTACAFGILWTAVFFAGAIRFQRKRTFLVVERFGYYWDVKFAGVRLVIPWIDNVVLADDFLQKSVDLYKGIEIDFTDASAPVTASAWYQIGNPEELDAGRFDLIRDDVLTYTYRVRAAERASRIAELFQGALRPLLESATLSEVEKNGEDFATKGTDAARESLREIGVYPFPKRGIILADIALPQAVIALRERQLQGEVDAAAEVSRSRGYWQPLVDMQRELTKAGMRMTDQQIREHYLTMRGFETVQQTGSNISFVSPDLGGVLKSISIGSVDSGNRVDTKTSVAEAKGGA